MLQHHLTLFSGPVACHSNRLLFDVPLQVLKKRLKNDDGTDKSGLSESARKAVDKVAGVKRRELKARCAIQSYVFEQLIDRKINITSIGIPLLLSILLFLKVFSLSINEECTMTCDC